MLPLLILLLRSFLLLLCLHLLHIFLLVILELLYMVRLNIIYNRHLEVQIHILLFGRLFFGMLFQILLLLMLQNFLISYLHFHTFYKYYNSFLYSSH